MFYYPNPKLSSFFIIFILYHPYPLSSLSFIILILYPPHSLLPSSFIILILYHPHHLSSSSFIIIYHPHSLSFSSFIILILSHPSSFIILVLYHPHPLSSSFFIILIVIKYDTSSLNQSFIHIPPLDIPNIPPLASATSKTPFLLAYILIFSKKSNMICNIEIIRDIIKIISSN